MKINRSINSAMCLLITVLLVVSSSLLVAETELRSLRGGDLTISSISHIGLSTGDMDRSIHFYRDLMGMEFLGQGEIEDKEIYDNIFGLENTHFKIGALRLGEMRIELFEFKRPLGKANSNREPQDHGFNHICFEVSDIQKEYKRLKQAGVAFHYPPQTWPSGAKAAYGRDPDGNIFELREAAAAAKKMPR